MNTFTQNEALPWMNFGEFIKFILWSVFIFILGASMAFVEFLTEPVHILTGSASVTKLTQPGHYLHLGNMRIDEGLLASKLSKLQAEERFKMRFFENELYTWAHDAIKDKVEFQFLMFKATVNSAINFKIEKSRIQVAIPFELDLFFKKIQIYCSFKLKSHANDNKDLYLTEFFFGGARIPFINFLSLSEIGFIGKAFFKENWIKSLNSICERLEFVHIQNNQLILER